MRGLARLYGRVIGAVCLTGASVVGVGVAEVAAAQCPVMRDLGTFGTLISDAFGVNNRGEAVVWSTPPGDLSRTAVVNVTTGAVRVLSSLDNVFNPTGINDRGQVIGDLFVPPFLTMLRSSSRTRTRRSTWER